MTDGPWIKYMMEEETGEPFENNFEVVLNPTFSANASLSWNYNHALAICAQSRNKMYAARFIDSVTVEPDVGGLYYQLSGHLPLNKEQIESPEFDRPNFRPFGSRTRIPSVSMRKIRCLKRQWSCAWTQCKKSSSTVWV